MSFRISPLYWSFMAIAAPVLIPLLMRWNRHFEKNRALAAEDNQRRIREAQKLYLPELDRLDLTVLVETKRSVGSKAPR